MAGYADVIDYISYLRIALQSITASLICAMRRVKRILPRLEKNQPPRLPEMEIGKETS